MLAADRSLLEINLKQSAIKLREKVTHHIDSTLSLLLHTNISQELNLYTENFSAMATQAAVLAGFTTTCLIEMTIPPKTEKYLLYFMHFAAVVSISANIACVSLATITSIWGSGKALRGKDGSMDEAVDGMSKERGLIFKTFSIGLAGNLASVMGACMITMESPINYLSSAIVLYTAYVIYTNATRIQKRFAIGDKDTVRLDDLTNYPFPGNVHGALDEIGKKT